MQKATIYTSPYYFENRQFSLHDPVINNNNCLYPLFLLKEKFAEKGIDLSTQDINKPEESIFVIYNDMPSNPSEITHPNSYLLLIESKLIRPDNWILQNHQNLKKIFTWSDDLVDGIRYIKINFSQKLPDLCIINPIEERKLCVLINSNKQAKGVGELYSERIKAIRWFEKNHPHDFDLYGVGWDLYLFRGKFSLLNHIPNLRKIINPHYISYKGQIDYKIEVMKQYKFSICYENIQDLPGYITEKIFDSFFSGCVPIYLGANNISSYIPPNTYIDKRNFPSYEELYEYISSMGEAEYTSYLKNIFQFLKSDKFYPFSDNFFVNTLILNIFGDLNLE